MPLFQVVGISQIADRMEDGVLLPLLGFRSVERRILGMALVQDAPVRAPLLDAILPRPWSQLWFWPWCMQGRPVIQFSAAGILLDRRICRGQCVYTHLNLQARSSPSGSPPARIVPDHWRPILTITYAHLSGRKGVSQIKKEGKGIKRVNINLEVSLHNAFKSAVAAQGVDMTTVLMQFIQTYIAKYESSASKQSKSRRA